MELNITGLFSEELDQAFWCLSEAIPPESVKSRLQMGCVEAMSMLMSDSPLLVSMASGKRPKIGQLAPGVFFCEPESFALGEYFLTNEAFWNALFPRRNLFDTLCDLGELLENGEMSATLILWEAEVAFHCVNVYPR